MAFELPRKGTLLHRVENGVSAEAALPGLRTKAPVPTGAAEQGCERRDVASWEISSAEAVGRNS